VETVDLGPAGLTAEALVGDERVEWFDGAIIAADGMVPPSERVSTAQMAVLALSTEAAGSEAHKLAVSGQDPGTWPILQSPGGLAAEPMRWTPYGGTADAAFRYLLAGPQGVSRLGAHALFHVEALRQARPPRGGVIVLWLGVGTMSPLALRRALATVDAAGLEFQLFLRGREAVIVAGRALPTLDLQSLQQMFRDPLIAQTLLGDGLLHPAELLACYAGNSREMSELWQGVDPLRARAPLPAPRFARSLAEPVRPGSLLLLVQYRALGPERVRQLLREDADPAQMRVLLHNYDAMYDTQTRADLLRIGRGIQTGGDPARQRMLRAMDDEKMRLDLIAPGLESRTLQKAAVLDLMALHGTAADLLERHIEAGQDSLQARLLLGRQYERRGEWRQALAQYRRARQMDPDNEIVERRMERVKEQLRPTSGQPQMPTRRQNR
jgi:tetratricopeptide (TPR) repeat protein